MADPFAQFADAPQQAAADPFAAFKDAPEAAPAAPAFKIDFGKPVPEVRKQISRLPAQHRAEAMKQWADTFVAKEREGGGAGQYIKDKLRNVAQGVPVLGAYADELNAGTAALAHRLTGGTMGAPYDEAKAYQDATDRAINKDANHLFTIPSAKWSGGILPDVPVTDADAARLGGGLGVARALPMVTAMRGETIIPATVNSAVNGLLYGTAHGSGEGNSMSERGMNALYGGAIGTGLGAAAVPVIRGVSNLGAAAKSAMTPTPAPLKPYSAGAIKNVTAAGADDGVFITDPKASRITPNAYEVQSMRLGPEGTLADMGPNLASEAGGIASLPGPGRKMITETLGRNANEGRRAGAADRIRADADLVLGPAQNTVEAEAMARKIGGERAKPHYDEFYATEIKPTEELVQLLHRVPVGVWQRAQQLAQGEGVDLARVANTGRGIDLIKRGLDDFVRTMDNGTNEQRIFSDLTRKIVSEVDHIVAPRGADGRIKLNAEGKPDIEGGSWAQGRSKSGDWIQFRKGMEEGRSAFNKDTHPDQMRADLDKSSTMYRTGYEIGARAQVRDTLSGNATTFGPNGDSAARKLLGSDYAREKLGIVTDQTPLVRSPTTQPQQRRTINQATQTSADYVRVSPERLTNRLDTESVFEGTRQKVLGNSVTAERTAAQKRYSAPGGQILPGTESVYGDVKRLLGAALNKVSGGMLAERVMIKAADAADMLMAQGAKRDEIARALIQYARTQNATAEAKRSIMRVAHGLMAGARSDAIEAVGRETAPQGTQRRAQPALPVR